MMARGAGDARAACHALFALLLAFPCSPAQDDQVLRAMKDELARSSALQVEKLERPYHVAYSLQDGESLAISATLGALIGVRRTRFRQPEAEVRVGSAAFDNTNYIFSEFPFGSRYATGSMPLDDDYSVLRLHWWLATDHAYKSALEAIARKRAALKNFTVSEQQADFGKAEPSKFVERSVVEPLDEELWKRWARDLSAVFSGYPRIVSSSVEVEAVQGAFYFVSSEGSEVRLPQRLIYVVVRAAALAPDGMMVRNAAVFPALDFARIPSELDLNRGVREVADALTSLAAAPLGESFTGPVLFEGQAAAQLFAEVLGRNLSVKRRPVSEPGRPIPFAESELEGRLGSRILPDWMNVVDDPTQSEWRGHPLLGHYPVDLEGVRPVPLSLVENGILKNFLLTRQPVRGFAVSNGRARLPGNFGAKAAGFGNLFVRASQSMPPADLKKKLLDLCRQRNKPYAMLVRKMDFPSSAPAEEFRRLAARMAQSGGSAPPVSLPTLIYRVYADGKEELVRGLRFRDLSVRSLRDILAAAEDANVLDYLDNGAPFALMGAGSFVSECSVIAPSVLFEDLQLERSEDELPKTPVVPPPPLVASR